MALARGLIDGIGDLRSVMRARFGDKVRWCRSPSAARAGWLPRLGPLARPAASRPRWSPLGEILDRRERALWARFGL